MTSNDALPLESEPKPLGESFELRLRMISDWHVGSGGGRPGSVDSLVRRDPDDLPYVPAKTLTGIWRDACELVALGLDNDDKAGGWNQWVNYLFGDQPAVADAETKGADKTETAKNEVWSQPRRAVLSVRSAFMPSDLRQALRCKSVAREAVTFVKPGISIHPRTGSARNDFLRFDEMVRGGISLVAKAELFGTPDEDRKVCSALLIAGARMVERVGGKRRRGAGRCELSIVGYEEILTWVDWIERHPATTGPTRRQTQNRINNDGDLAAIGNWLGLKLLLKTKLPVIAPSGTIGNLIKTLDYIPGTYLLQHVTKKLNGVNARAAIARGDLLVTNATIEVDGAKGRPVPFCLAHPKMSGGLKEGRGVFNLLRDEERPAQEKNHRKGYVGPTSELNPLPAFDIIDPVVETHNVVKDEVQRPTEDIGGVYSYQAIPAGIKLIGELRLRQSLCDELSEKDSNWFRKLKGELRLGRASKDDYGAVELEAIGDPELVTCEPIREELTVWLLSDLLLRDERLRPTASIGRLGQALSDRLKVTLEPQPKLTHARQRRTDSWHVGWGLPRPSLAGLQAGTCAVFKFEGEIDPELLAEIEGGGLGERRAEGYGQICFNHPLVTSELKGLKRNDPERNGVPETPALVTESFDYARLLEYQAARNEINRIAPGFAADRENRKRALGIEISGGRSKPRMSQLGALRSVISRVRGVSDSRRVLDWTERVAKSQNRRGEWPNERPAHVEELMTNTDRVWQILNVNFNSLVLTEDGEERLKQELWAEAMRALVSACVRAHKRDLEGE